MTTTITRVTKPVADVHEWDASELSNNDIIGVYESLGQRPAHTVTIQSPNGDSVVRFNVIKPVHSQRSVMDAALLGGQAGQAPILLAELEETKDNITILQGSTQTWEISEIPIKDIKVITKTTGMKITIT